MLRVVLQPLQAGSDESENFGRIVFNLFFRRADTARRITRKVISRVREPAVTFTEKNELSRRAEQTGGDNPGPERRRQLDRKSVV